MSSSFANPERRSPRQARATRRRAKILEVAAELFAEHGYEGVTMTQVAEKAETSIGALYDYFPDKQNLAHTLLAQYIEEAETNWPEAIGPSSGVTKPALAELLINQILKFMEARPAYVALMGGPKLLRSPQARQPLRLAIARGLQTITPNLEDDRAFLSAQIIVEVLKDMIFLYRETEPQERQKLVDEYKKLLNVYVVETL